MRTFHQIHVQKWRVNGSELKNLKTRKRVDVEGSAAETEEIVDDVINEETIEKFAKKTNRQLRINELIKEHSSQVLSFSAAITIVE